MPARYKSTRSMSRGFSLVLLCLIVFTAAYSWLSWRSEKKAQTDQLSLLADLESKSLDSFFSHFETSLKLLSQDLKSADPSMKGEPAYRLLKRLKQADQHELANINIVQLDGQVIASALNPPGSQLPNIAQVSSFILGRDALLNGRDFDIGRPFVGRLVNEWIIPMRYAIRDADGSLLYIIQTTLPLSRQQSFWQSLYLPADTILGMLRDDGYLLSRYPVTQGMNLQEAYGQPRTGVLKNFLKDQHFPQKGIVAGIITIGENHVIAFHRLASHPVTFWISRPASSIYALWWQHNRGFYLLTGIFLLSGIVIYLWLLRRQDTIEFERETANQQLIDAIQAKNQAENELLGLELDDVKLALDQHSLVSITDVAGNITYANEKFCKVSGYSSEELLGKNHRILNSGLHTPEFFTDMWQTISSGRVWHGQIRNKDRDGAFYWVESTIVPFLNQQAKPYQYVSVRTDITEFIQARVAAEEANRAKTQFLSSMSHELRTPLNSILGFGQLLQMQIEPDKRSLHEYVNYILTAGNQLLGLINDLLDLSRIEIGKLEFNIEDCRIADLASSSVSLVESSLASDRNITIQSTFDDTELLVKGDALRIRQVLINLLSNAVKYNRENGRVNLSSEILKDGMLRIKVQDTGEGIASEDLPLLFTHFERLEQKHGAIEGAGIGLYVCKQLVEAMQGTIGVESVKGEGSTFWFTLPVADESSIADKK